MTETEHSVSLTADVAGVKDASVQSYADTLMNSYRVF